MAAPARTVRVTMDTTGENSDERRGWKGQPGWAEQRYTAGAAGRESYLIRARRLSLLTIPALHRQPGATGTNDEITPWQSLGGIGVNNLAAKEVLALVPPGLPFIRLKATKRVMDDIDKLPPDNQAELHSALQRGLSKVEQELVDCCEEDGDRAFIFDMLRHLNVAGTHCLKVDPTTSELSSVPLEQFVNWRDKKGNLVEAVIEDILSWETVPDDIRILCQRNGYELDDHPEKHSTGCQEPVKVYTHIYREGKTYEVYQEVCGLRVPDSEQAYALDELPFLFIPLILQKGEDYGRSYCEDYEGDLQTLDGLWQVMVESAAAIAKLVRLVKPGGVTSKKALAEAANGEILTGDAEDVTTVQAEKQADMSVASNRADKVEERLNRVFLLYSPRTGERVTLGEVQATIKELETGLGGVYSHLVVTFQRPYALLKMRYLAKAGRLTKLPKDQVKPVVLTGAAALGRFAEGQNLTAWAASIPQWLIQAVAPYINAKVFLERSAIAFSVDEADLVLTDEQVQAKVQQAQASQMANQVAPEVVKQGGQMLSKQVPDATDAPPPDASGGPPPQTPAQQ